MHFQRYIAHAALLCILLYCKCLMLAVQPSTRNTDDVCTGTLSPVLRQFELNPLLRGGDAVRVENLSAQSDYQRKKMDYTRHKREQQEREKMQMRFRSKAETHLRVVPIQGDGRCLFRALVSFQAGPQYCAAMHRVLMLTSLPTTCVCTHLRAHTQPHRLAAAAAGEGSGACKRAVCGWGSRREGRR